MWHVLQVSRKGVYGGGIEFDINKCNGTIENFKIEPG